MSTLLDTHILLYWLGNDVRLSKAQKRAIQRASVDRPIMVSDITLWEVANLHSLDRIRLSLPLREWLEAATAAPLVRRIGISPSVAAAVAGLPSTFHRDPADRIIVATAQLFNATLLTHDTRIIDSGVVPTLS